MPKLPDAIGKYRVIERLGRGGMGLVYKAEHPTLGSPVVLKKLMLKGSRIHRERFRREAALTMGIRHENVVAVYDHFKEGAAYYLVMEYVDGQALSEILQQKGALSTNEAAWIIGRVSLALETIHSYGIIHRDLKPSNILLGRDGTVKLCDFGIAYAPDDGEVLTAEGTALGTPSYMAPEQLLDARNADGRSDIWSLGVCFFELLTAQKFITGPTAAAIREALPKAVRNCRTRLPLHLPRPYRRFLGKCLALNPMARLSSGRIAERLIGRSTYDATHELNFRMTHLQSVQNSSVPLGGELLKDKPPIKTSHNSLSLPAAILLPIILGLVLFGLWNELIKVHRIGSFRLMLNIPEQASDYWAEGAKVNIYRWDGRILDELDNPAFRKSRGGMRLETRIISLPVGMYRVRWSLGDRVAWRSFYLDSINHNRAQNQHPLILKETLEPPPVFPLELNADASDAMTGQSLDAQIRWERLDNSDGGLESGGSLRLTMEAEGYRGEMFSIVTSPWRRKLTVHAALWPLPSTVHIQNSSSESIKPRLNGRQSYLDLSQEPEMKTIGILRPNEEKVLSLPPGRHLFSPGDVNVTTHASESVSLVVEINSEGRAVLHLQAE